MVDDNMWATRETRATGDKGVRCGVTEMKRWGGESVKRDLEKDGGKERCWVENRIKKVKINLLESWCIVFT